MSYYKHHKLGSALLDADPSKSMGLKMHLGGPRVWRRKGLVGMQKIRAS
jgi:hypothetical protein